MLWKLLLPIIIIIIGIKLLIGGFSKNKANAIFIKMKESGNDPQVYNVTFSSNNVNYDGQVFEGAQLSAVFGDIKCDLRNAIIEKDCAIKVSAVFGGVDILIPENVNVIIDSDCVFGEINNKTADNNNAVTIYISGTCVFGGIEIK